jgi:hypothetical protein
LVFELATNSLLGGELSLSQNQPECTVWPIDDAWATYTMAVNTIPKEFPISSKVSLEECTEVYIERNCNGMFS